MRNLCNPSVGPCMCWWLVVNLNVLTAFEANIIIFWLCDRIKGLNWLLGKWQLLWRMIWKCKTSFLFERKLIRIYMSQVDTVNTEFCCLLNYWWLKVWSLTFCCFLLLPTKNSFKSRRIETIWDPCVTGLFVGWVCCLCYCIQSQFLMHSRKPKFYK